MLHSHSTSTFDCSPIHRDFTFFPLSFFLFRSHITVLDSASIHTQNTSKLCECCFQYEARFYCVSIASMNCDEMKAHWLMNWNECKEWNCAQKASSFLLNVLLYIFDFVSSYNFDDGHFYIRVYRNMGTGIVRRWLLRTFHVVLLENRIDLNYNELQFKSKKPLWIAVKSEVTAMKAIDDQTDDGVWKCCYCFLPPLMVLTFVCRWCACIFCVRQFFRYVTHVNKLDYFSGVDSWFQPSCGEHSESVLWARQGILCNLFA